MTVAAASLVSFFGSNDDEFTIVGSGLTIDEALGAISFEGAALGTNGSKLVDMTGVSEKFGHGTKTFGFEV